MSGLRFRPLLLIGLLLLTQCAGHGSGSPARCACDPAAKPPAPLVGQWIWTRNDVARYEQTKERTPDLVPAVLVATITTERGRLVRRRALSPALVDAGPAGVGVTIRFDDAIHESWADRAPGQIARELTPLLAELLAEIRATGVRLAEVQLDYDAPVRRLAAWAAVVQQLATGALADLPIWVTSIPAHLADPHFGRRLCGAVAGHIIQLFDTGLRGTEGHKKTLLRQLRDQGLPFRLGLGGYERCPSGRCAGDHRFWLSVVRDLAGEPGYGGLWVFPAGQEYAPQLLALLEEER